MDVSASSVSSVGSRESDHTRYDVFMSFKREISLISSCFSEISRCCWLEINIF
ncbi:hypothetical protein Hdeb2414_s0021g00570641 [Helianthus debilis subsp. tardiflorus]